MFDIQKNDRSPWPYMVFENGAFSVDFRTEAEAINYIERLKKLAPPLVVGPTTNLFPVRDAIE